MTMDINNLELDDLESMDAAEPAGGSVGTLPESEPTAETDDSGAMTAEEWEAGAYYSVTITADPGDAATPKQATAGSYDEYIELRKAMRENGLYITSESFKTMEDALPGLLTYDAAVNIFETSNDKYINLKSFPEFSKRAKIGVHDNIALAADTGGGKSSLAINIIDDLNDEYSILYFNLEMKEITVLQRLVSIHSGLKLDVIEGYKKDERTAQAVNKALKEITNRKPLQVISEPCTLEDVEMLIKHSTQFRTKDEPTIVIIDHSLLIKTGEADRYKRFTAISEKLHEMANGYDIIIFSLLQQNREGKKDETEPPKNSSLKESGSWENDSTLISFLWYDPTAGKKKLIITKNRAGKNGAFTLNYDPTTQKYSEEKDQAAGGRTAATGTTPSGSRKRNPKERKRDKERRELEEAYTLASIKASLNGVHEVTAADMAEAADKPVGTIQKLLKEYGGYTVDGVKYEPKGINSIVEGDGLAKPTPTQEAEAKNNFNRA